MKNKFKWLGIGGAVLLIVVIVVCALAFGGNGDRPAGTTPTDTHPTGTTEGGSVPPESSLSDASSSEAVKQQMENMLDAVFDIPTEETVDDPAFLIEVDKLNGYEVLSFEETEAGAIATIRVFAPDLYSVAKMLDSDGVTRTEDELLEAINDAVKNAELVEKQLTLEFVKTEDGYAPVLTSEFLDALYGGVFRLYDDLLNAE